MKKKSCHAHKTGSWYLLGVLFKISDERALPSFLYGSFPGADALSSNWLTDWPFLIDRSIDRLIHPSIQPLIHSFVRLFVPPLPDYRPPVLSLHGCQPVSPAISYFYFRLHIVVLLVISYSRFVFARVSRVINPGLSNFKDLNSSLFLLVAYGPLGMWM